MTNETKNNQTKTNETNTNETKRQLSLPMVVTGIRAGQGTLASAMPPPGI
jgi:hypothetical protein